MNGDGAVHIKRRETLILIDRLNALCQTGKLTHDLNCDTGMARKINQGTLNMLRRSQRYYIDDSVTEAAMTLAQEHPDILCGMLKRARSPYPVTWLEWDNHVRLRCIGREPDFDAPIRVGAIIERLDDSRPRYRMSSYAVNEGEDGIKSTPPMLSVVYDLDAPISDNAPESAEAALLSRLTKLPQEYMRLAMLGSSWNGPKGEVGTFIPNMFVGDQEGMQFFQKLLYEMSKHAVWGFNPIVLPAVLPTLHAATKNSFKWKEWCAGLQAYIFEDAGLWRFVISLLALLNAHNFIEQEHPGRTEGRFTYKSKSIPYLQHRVVKLKLPRKIVERQALREYSELAGQARPRHEVAGHFAESRKRGDPNCEHAWVRETDTRDRCVLCKKAFWWVRDHCRGSAEVGFILEERLVQTK